MHRSCSQHSGPDAGDAAQINDGSGTAVASRVAENAALLTYELEPQGFRKELAGELVGIEPESDRINPANGVLGWYARARPAHARVGSRMRDKLPHESFVVLEGDNALVLIACSRLRELDPLLYQPFYPETDGAGEYRE